MENEYGEYFQLAFFLITELMKGKDSFYEPFISYLPEDIQTLYTYPDATKISSTSERTLLDEIQNLDDDIFDKIRQDREHLAECKSRFVSFITQHLPALESQTGLDYSKAESLFDWAWMNVGTRCFGTHHFPSSIAMVPLIDLLNHHTGDEKLRFYVYPLNLGIKMVERGDTQKVNRELALDYMVEEEPEKYDSQDYKREWDS